MDQSSIIRINRPAFASSHNPHTARTRPELTNIRVLHPSQLHRDGWDIARLRGTEGAGAFRPLKPSPRRNGLQPPGTVHLEPRTLNLEPLKTLSSPSNPKNPHNSHPINHFPPKNSWHTSYAPLDTINTWIKSIEGQLRSRGNKLPPPARTVLSQPNKPHRINILAATHRE